MFWVQMCLYFGMCSCPCLPNNYCCAILYNYFLIALLYFVYFLRYESHSGGEREIQRTLLELLNQLDGFDSRGDVKVFVSL